LSCWSEKVHSRCPLILEGFCAAGLCPDHSRRFGFAHPCSRVPKKYGQAHSNA
jgi:hypothetical protein